ncbi:hypothetical protein, partial [Pseudidiomarina gelatinasegens]|uniref:hypothetical protein n=1 Tax=Pseudidiomarina gelatinasegens TaxID=2487740 RepID=UPI001C700946
MEHLLDRKKSGDRRVILAQYSYPISAYPDAYQSVVLRVRMTIYRSFLTFGFVPEADIRAALNDHS